MKVPHIMLRLCSLLEQDSSEHEQRTRIWLPADDPCSSLQRSPRTFNSLNAFVILASSHLSDPIMPTIKETKEQVERILGVEKKKPSDGRLDWLSQQLSELRQSSAVKQVAVGTACGWVSGLVCGKFGRTAATAVGGSVICLHLAQQYGYITINWKRVNGDMAKAKKELEKTARDDAPEFLRQLQTFVVENMLLASGFGGGLLLGLASS